MNGFQEALDALREVGTIPLIAGGLLALLAGSLSVQVILNRIVFVAAALSQVGAVGIAFALLMGWDDAVPCALVATAVTVMILSRRGERGKVPSETILGIVYAAGMAGSILLVSKSAVGNEEVAHLLEGELLFVGWNAVWHLGLAALAILTLQIGAFRHLVMVGFDPDGAQALGYRLRRWRFMLYLCIGVTVAVGMDCGGSLLTFAYLVLPGAIALRLSSHLVTATLLAPVIAVGAHVLGLFSSFHPGLDVPSAPTTVTLLFAGFLLAVVLERIRRNASGPQSA